VVELLDSGLLNVPWYPIVGMNCSQKISFNYGSEEFCFPILDFEADELKNRCGFDTQAFHSADSYCTHVYHNMISLGKLKKSCLHEKFNLNKSPESYKTYGNLKEFTSSNLQLNSKTKFYGTLSQVKSSWSDSSKEEICLRKRKIDSVENVIEEGIITQRYKSWNHSEGSRAGSLGGSSINDSWEDDPVDPYIGSNRKLNPRFQIDGFLSTDEDNDVDNQSIDENQSCIAVEGEMTLAEYLQIADSGIAVMQDSDVIDGRIIDEDIENDRIAKFEEEVEDNESDEDNERSIATSLFVEVYIFYLYI
jgi:hypothetical protein